MALHDRRLGALGFTAFAFFLVCLRPFPVRVVCFSGHRGVHRESRFISGYGGMTGVGFDEFLAAAELKESQSRSGREEAQGTPVPRSLEDSH